jgi:ribonucleoside-diphosphate reductase alpha chain
MQTELFPDENITSNALDMASATTNTAAGAGLKFSRHFTTEGVSPYDAFQYEYRTSIIRNPNGEIKAELKDVEVPAHWSQIATDILAQKYFRRAGVPQADGSLGRETSVKQVAHRLADCWRSWGYKYGYFASEQDAQVFYEELVFSILAQSCAPNSPQWFNTGLHNSYGITGDPQGHYYVEPTTGKLERSKNAYERPQPHACFILSVADDLVNDGGIMDLWVREARIFKYGSGVGTNYSNIRAEGEKLSGGGSSSGLMSFLKIGDRAAGAIKSGGTTRRAAKMVCLDLTHPEAPDFIDWKVEEEKKVAALIAAGYSSDYEGEAYRTVSGQNSNNSVRIPNEFFRKLAKGEDWEMTARSDGKVMKKISSRALWDKISYAAWRCADPGTQYDTTINEWHTCPEGGRINASNPCSEYMFLDNTACNLASLNLRRFFNEETSHFDVEGFEYGVRLWTVVLEISVLMAQFPSPEVAQLSYDYRTLGLGYANLGSMLMVSGIPYDSNEGRAIAGAITAIMNGVAYKTSAEMASVLGAFPEYEKNKEHMLRVMRNHRLAAYDAGADAYDNLETIPQGINAKYCPDYLLTAATKAWDDAVQYGEQWGYRNAQATVIAPTGTIGLVMDCDTTGVEPDFALVKFKKLSGGGYMKIVNQSVPAALKKLGYDEKTIDAIVKYAKGHATFAGAPYINHETLSAKGFIAEEIKKLDKSVESAFEIGFVFNHYNLGEECLQRLGFQPEQYNDMEFSLLHELGFSDEEIEACNDYVCGTMMMEGAPGLKNEHLPVFDTANKCGKRGERYIHAHGHIRMMAAVQPFISGAISKTINLPNEATVDEIKDCYHLSWKLGIKACALYRDGSKLSQPLSNKSDKKGKKKDDTATAEAAETTTQVAAQAEPFDISTLTVDELLEEVNKRVQASPDTKLKRELSRIVERKNLPAKRRGYTFKGKVGGQPLFLRTGEYGDGTIGEIFIDMAKEGATMRSLTNSFAIAVSVGLQYGVPLEEYVDKFIFTRFEPSGIVDHPNIKTATSVLDYIFRVLAYEYLDRDDLVHVKDEEHVSADTNSAGRELHVTPKGLPPAPSEGGGVQPAPVSNGVATQALQGVKVNGINGAFASITTTKPVVSSSTHTHGSLAEAKADVKKMMGTSADAPACSNCGNITLRNGTCYMCPNCGTTTGCS